MEFRNPSTIDHLTLRLIFWDIKEYNWPGAIA
jgi:hypothetical protein